jgi:hypothetical protein
LPPRGTKENETERNSLQKIRRALWQTEQKEWARKRDKSEVDVRFASQKFLIARSSGWNVIFCCHEAAIVILGTYQLIKNFLPKEILSEQANQIYTSTHLLDLGSWSIHVTNVGNGPALHLALSIPIPSLEWIEIDNEARISVAENEIKQIHCILAKLIYTLLPCE